MATKFFCDRCDFVTTDTDEIFSLNYPVWTQYSNSDLEKLPKKSIDICAACIKSLNEWIKLLPKTISGEF